MASKVVTAVIVIILMGLSGVTGYYLGSTLNPRIETQTVIQYVQVPPPTNRSIIDMIGRNITVPYTINRVLCAGPMEMELVYMIAPEKLAGLSFTYNGAGMSYTPGEPLKPLVPEFMKPLPVVGGWFGTQTGNFETFIGLRPDIILDGQHKPTDINDFQAKFGNITVVELNSSWSNTISGYTDAIRFVGDLLGVSDKAQSLINYYHDAMDYVNSITSQLNDSTKVKVYYAEGKDGLSTDPKGSMHTDLMRFCGAINVADVNLLPGYGMSSVSPEQILSWNPDVIIIGRGSQFSLYKTVLSNTTWSSINAVINNRVYVRPDNPFSWFDGPPGPMQIVGMYWMVHTLYPAQTSGLDLVSHVKLFYSEFIHYNLNDTEVADLLSNPKI
jgi:iron complex transport system substrate-binding protein